MRTQRCANRDPWPQLVSKGLNGRAQEDERAKSFELLDALSRSGALPFEHACLHVLVAATHCFGHSLLDTVVSRNVNPIEKLERSSLIINMTVQGLASHAPLLRDEARERVARFSAPVALPPPHWPPPVEDEAEGEEVG